MEQLRVLTPASKYVARLEWALLLIADEIEAGRETQLSPEKIRDVVAEGGTTRQGTATAESVGSAASGASPQREVGDNGV